MHCHTKMLRKGENQEFRRDTQTSLTSERFKFRRLISLDLLQQGLFEAVLSIFSQRIVSPKLVIAEIRIDSSADPKK